MAVKYRRPLVLPFIFFSPLSSWKPSHVTAGLTNDNKRGINKAEENDDNDDYGDDDDHPSPSSQTQPCERLVLTGTVRRARSKFKLFNAMLYTVDVMQKFVVAWTTPTDSLTNWHWCGPCGSLQFKSLAKDWYNRYSIDSSIVWGIELYFFAHDVVEFCRPAKDRFQARCLRSIFGIPRCPHYSTFWKSPRFFSSP